MVDLKVDWLGGNCPVQAEGTVKGLPFYFRARGTSWSFVVGEDISNPVWEYKQEYGEWPTAGWMTEEEAIEFIKEAANKFDRRNLRLVMKN